MRLTTTGMTELRMPVMIEVHGGGRCSRAARTARSALVIARDRGVVVHGVDLHDDLASRRRDGCGSRVRRRRQCRRSTCTARWREAASRAGSRISFESGSSCRTAVESDGGRPAPSSDVDAPDACVGRRASTRPLCASGAPSCGDARLTTVPSGGYDGIGRLVDQLQEDVDDDTALRVRDEVDLPSGLAGLLRTELRGEELGRLVEALVGVVLVVRAAVGRVGEPVHVVAVVAERVGVEVHGMPVVAVPRCCRCPPTAISA